MMPFSLFWSPDPVAQVVIIVLGAVFTLWFLYLVGAALTLQNEYIIAARLEDVSWLQKRIRERNESHDGLVRRGEIEAEFRKKNQLPAESPVVQHVLTLFQAGWSDARLDIRFLVEHTSHKLFRRNATAKAILGVFIVIGLLGTLMGLSQALVPLSGLDLSSSISASSMSPLLQTLLDKLKSAFAPSVVGVTATVVGVFLYSTYLSLLCTPLQSKIEHLTVHVWVPTLFPTTSQLVLETLEEANRQAHENMAAAQRVADFAERLESDLQDLQPSVRVANEKIRSFHTTIDHLDRVGQSFSRSLQGLASFQEQIAGLLEEMLAYGHKSNEVLSSVNGQTNVLIKHTSDLANNIRILHVFEDTYRESQKKTEEALQKLIHSVGSVYEKLGDRNIEIVNSLRDPLLDSLSEERAVIASSLSLFEKTYLASHSQAEEQITRFVVHAEDTLKRIGQTNAEMITGVTVPINASLQQIDSNLHDGLSNVRATLSSIQNPLEHSAERIDGIAASFTKNVERMIGDVQGEFRRQNEVNVESRDALLSLNHNIVQLAQTLESVVSRHEEVASQLARIHGLPVRRRRTLSQRLKRIFSFGISRNGHIASEE